jgi:hypothetical protein
MVRLVVVTLVFMFAPMKLEAADTVVRLNVQPMAVPRPVLKYTLLPVLREMNPGNPAQWYVRCFQEQRNFFFGKEATAERAQYRSMPLAELAAKKLPSYGGHALTQADWGARLDTLDWQLLQRVQTEGMDLRLPELPPLRILGPALQVRLRIEVARRDFDDAVRTAKTMFAMARHLGEHPTVAGNLDGLALADLALDALEEMIQQPGCPNLYWALTDLPHPLVEIRKGLQGHCALVATELKPLRDDVAMTDSELQEFVSRLSGSIGYRREQAGLPPRNLRGDFAGRVNDLNKLGTARASLLAADGWDAGRALSSMHVLSFPALQIVLLFDKRDFALRSDADMKFVALPAWQIPESADRDEGVFSDFAPSVIALRRAQGRLEQRVALLRHVEALRMYAAAHNGQLPATLSELAVPLPDDPLTGRPFAYQREAASALLRPGGPTSQNNRDYAVTIHN